MSDFIPTLIIDTQTMDDANASVSRFLKVPEHARKTPKARFWTEQFDVVGSSISAVEDDPEYPEKNGRVKVTVQFAVAPESAFLENVGRAFFCTYFINPKKMGDKASKERTMSLMSIGRLNNLLRAAGFDIDGGTQMDYGQYFGSGEDQTPLIQGAKVFAKLKDYLDKDKEQRQDVTQFVSLDAEQEG